MSYLCKDRPASGKTTLSSKIYPLHESVAIDTDTGLMWQRFNLGQVFENGQATGDAQRLNFDDALKEASECEHLGFKDWRVPTIKELLSIVDYERFNPAIDTNVFLGAVPDYYWSSSPVTDVSGNGWVVDFYDGYDDWYGKHYGNFVRLVRNNV